MLIFFQNNLFSFFFFKKIPSRLQLAIKVWCIVCFDFCRITKHHHYHSHMLKRLELNRPKVRYKHCCMICMRLVQRRLICRLEPSKKLNKMLRLVLNIRLVLRKQLELQSILALLQQRPTNKRKRSRNINNKKC